MADKDAKGSFRIVDSHDIPGHEPNATIWHRFFGHIRSTLLATNVCYEIPNVIERPTYT